MAAEEAAGPNVAPAATGQARAALARWEDFGGTWRLERVRGRIATVSLYRCDGGEVVEVLESDDPAFVRWVTDDHGAAHDP